MKLIKILVAMSIINAILVVFAVQFLRSANPVPPNAVTQPMEIPVLSSSAKPVATRVNTPTQVVVATPTPKPTGCVIKIDGVSYDITNLLRTHSGGNVFTCGTDMSAIFWGRHNQRILQIMQQYRI